MKTSSATQYSTEFITAETQCHVFCFTVIANGNAYRILVRKPEGKRPLGRLRRRWVDNIKMYLRETGEGGMDRIDLAQDRDQWRALQNTVMNRRVP
jgi:hypothetical protein